VIIRTLKGKCNAGEQLYAENRQAVRLHRSNPRHRRIIETYRAMNPLCECCKRHATREIHHIIPVAEGGKTEPENLLGVCLKCHAIIPNIPHGEQCAMKLEEGVGGANVKVKTAGPLPPRALFLDGIERRGG
jgi:hypothetical protein